MNIYDYLKLPEEYFITVARDWIASAYSPKTVKDYTLSVNRGRYGTTVRVTCTSAYQTVQVFIGYNRIYTRGNHLPQNVVNITGLIHRAKELIKLRYSLIT